MRLSYVAVGVLSNALMVLAAGVVSGQDYPNRPIRILTSSAGGGADFLARQMTQALAPLGQPAVVDNRGNSIVAADAAAKSAPDGYSLFVGGNSVWVFQFLQKAPYDMADLAPISLIAREVNILVVHPSLPVKSVKELIALAKAKPGMLNYALTAIGGSNHLAGELLKSMAGVNIALVPYKGQSLAMTAVYSGEVQLTIIDAGAVTPHVKAGKLRALAVSSAEPSALAPGLPTIAASGLSGYEAVGMSGLFAPGKTPGAIVTRINQEIVRYLNRADVKERLLNAGEEVVGNSPEQFATMMKADMVRADKLIKDAGIRMQ